MRKFGKFLLTTTVIGAGLILLGSIKLTPIAPATSANTTPVNTTIPVTPILSFPTPDYPRLLRMSDLLSGRIPNGYKEYKQLCLQAITTPAIGMTFDQARNTTWCFPYSRNKTTTAYGERVQEVYTKTLDSSHAFKYLYFENGILTTIQE